MKMKFNFNFAASETRLAQQLGRFGRN